MNDVVLLQYLFMFNPVETQWTRIADFENDLVKFFDSKNMEAKVLSPMAGSYNARIIKIEPIAEPVIEKVESMNIVKPSKLAKKFNDVQLNIRKKEYKDGVSGSNTR